MKEFIQPNWTAPSHIKAYTSTSALQTDIEDALQLPNPPVWLNQIHGNQVVEALPWNRKAAADASFTTQINQPCIIRTADCLPILLCSATGTHVAAVHGGWRSLVGGIIQNTIDALDIPPQSILAWLGPAISQMHYEIDEPVYSAFMAEHPYAAEAFMPSSPGHWFLSLYCVARLQLIKAGVTAIVGADYCTYRDSDQFFSYRREGAGTGRMMSVIWITQ